jgi:hypothetical protein
MSIFCGNIFVNNWSCTRGLNKTFVECNVCVISCEDKYSFNDEIQGYSTDQKSNLFIADFTRWTNLFSIKFAF